MPDPYELGDRVEVYVPSMAEDLMDLGLFEPTDGEEAPRGEWVRGTVRGTGCLNGVRGALDGREEARRGSLFKHDMVRPIHAETIGDRRQPIRRCSSAQNSGVDACPPWSGVSTRPSL